MCVTLASMYRSQRDARGATFAYFAVNGFVMGTWVVHINVIARQAGVGTATLGYLLLALGGSAFVGMRLCGPLNDRLGPRRVIPVSAALFSAAVVLPALTHNVWSLAGALAVLGFSNGCLDVSMNTHAVKVEHRYQRPIMSAFHATWSLGGVLASIVGARTISWGWPIAPTFTVIAVLAAATSLLAAPALLGNEAATGAPRPATAPRPRVPNGVWAIAAVAMMVMLCEGVAYDWSTVHLRTVIHASAATSALAYGAYATAATVGRLIADRLAARIGPVALFRCGATLAGVGMVTVVLSHQATLAIAGWAAVGLGLSGCIPQLFTAAGGLDRDAAGANVARVAGLGYLGMLAGPAIIGPLTRLVALNLALVLPTALCFAAAYAAGVLRPAPQPAERPARQPVSAD
jgi:predicted MFS family arabinose efflux permease